MPLRPLVSRLLAASAVGAALLATNVAHAAVAEPDPRDNKAFDVMNLLTVHHLHDLQDEDWNGYGQITDIYSQKLAFPSKYYDPNAASLSPTRELSFTETATLYLALRLWTGAEAYVVPEVIAEKPLSGLKGLGGVIQNFELQKNGNSIPTPYLSRAYLRQTIPLGGESITQDSQPGQLAHVDQRRRLVLTVGNFSVLDFFDKNVVAGDLRRSFLNMSFLSYAAYDFAADARGYAWGGMAEVYLDDWSVRFGRLTPPKDPNQLPLEFDLGKHYGDQVELEHDHELFGRAGSVHLLGYRNVENMGKFTDAIAKLEGDPGKNAAACPSANLFNYGSTSTSAPDLCWARKDNVKLGIGVSFVQQILPDLGAFVRGMYSDGQTEVYSYTSTDRSLSLGGVLTGDRWKRPFDTVGLGGSMGWISRSHAEYLAMGGVDGFIGDGQLRQAPEAVVEVYYRFAMSRSAWLTADYQRIWNPAYNADRGPVDILGGRVHVEF